MVRFHEWVKNHPTVDAAIVVVGLVSMIVGAAGHPADIAGWGDALAFIGEDAGRWVLVGIGLIVVIYFAVVGFRGKPAPVPRAKRSPSAPSSAEDGGALLPKVQDELAAIIRRGEEIRGDAFTEPGWDQYVYWKRAAADFLEAVLGAAARDRLTREESAKTRSQLIENCLSALREILDGLDEGAIRVDESGFAAAVHQLHAAPKGTIEAAKASSQAERDFSIGVESVGMEGGRLMLQIDPPIFGPAVVRLPHFRVTNKSKTDRMNIDLSIVLVRDLPNGKKNLILQNQGRESVIPPPVFWGLSDPDLHFPIRLEPEETVNGRVEFINSLLTIDGAGPEENPDNQLRVTDHISERYVEIPLQGGRYP